MQVEIHGTKFEVEAEHHKAYRGLRDSMGQQVEPDEEAYTEIVAITCKEDLTGVLADSVMNQIEAAIDDGDFTG